MLFNAILITTVTIVISIYLYHDARKRNYDKTGALLLGLSLSLIGLIIWLFIRPRSKSEKLIKMNTFIKIVLFIIFIIGAILLTLSLFFKVYSFSSASMEPTLHRGDLLFLTDANNLSVGDIAVYNKISFNSRFKIVHRVAEINSDYYIFKGDNNNQPDPPVLKQDVEGKLVFSIPFLGYPRLLLGI